jgi:hypothetical protein
MRYLLFAILLAWTAIAAAQPRAGSDQKAIVHLNPETCGTVPSDKRSWLPEAWQPFQAFVKLCPVARDEVPAFYVMSIWADDYYRAQPEDAPAVKFPKPLLFRPDGKNIGELPAVFPRDPPRTLDPIFLNWSKNFPHEIKLWLQDPAVLGDRYLPPLTWDEAAGRFAQRAARKEKTDGAESKH